MWTTHQRMSVFLGGAVLVSACLSGGLHLRAGVVVDALGLEEDVAVDVAPEVGDRVTAVAATGQQLQTALAARVGTGLTCKQETRQMKNLLHMK